MDEQYSITGVKLDPKIKQNIDELQVKAKTMKNLDPKLICILGLMVSAINTFVWNVFFSAFICVIFAWAAHNIYFAQLRGKKREEIIQVLLGENGKKSI